jgi:hypothetical protein
MSPLLFPWAPSFSPFSLTLPLVSFSHSTFLLISGIHSNTGPPRPEPNPDFLQFNVNGIQNSSVELLDFIVSHSIKVACIQETKLSARSKPPFFPGYALVRKDHPTGRDGGFAILVHNSVLYVNIDTTALTSPDPSLKLLAIQISIGGAVLDI